MRETYVDRLCPHIILHYSIKEPWGCRRIPSLLLLPWWLLELETRRHGGLPSITLTSIKVLQGPTTIYFIMDPISNLILIHILRMRLISFSFIMLSLLTCTIQSPLLPNSIRKNWTILWDIQEVNPTMMELSYFGFPSPSYLSGKPCSGIYIPYIGANLIGRPNSKAVRVKYPKFCAWSKQTQLIQVSIHTTIVIKILIAT